MRYSILVSAAILAAFTIAAPAGGSVSSGSDSGSELAYLGTPSPPSLRGSSSVPRPSSVPPPGGPAGSTWPTQEVAFGRDDKDYMQKYENVGGDIGQSPVGFHPNNLAVNGDHLSDRLEPSGVKVNRPDFTEPPSPTSPTSPINEKFFD